MAEEKKEIEIPKEIGVVPIKGGVIFPNLVAPLVITTPRLIKLIDDVLSKHKIIFVVAQKDTQIEEPKPKDLYSTGVISLILRMMRFPDNTVRLLVQGLKRGKIKKFTKEDPYLVAEIEEIKETVEDDKDTKALMRNVLATFQKLVEMAPYLSEELAIMALNIQTPDKLSDFIASYVNFSVNEKQELLEEKSAKKRLEKLLKLLSKEIEMLELGERIKERVKGEMDKAQREYFLREQLKAIQKELGMLDEKTAEINELKEKIEKAGMPEEAKKAAYRELERLQLMPPHAAEYVVARTYLDWLVNLPWSKSTEDNLDIKRAKKILDEDHYNLEKVKERILEYLAVKKLKPDSKGPILCFVGPPGVGKTSLGKSIARALGRKFVRISLGGIRDEAEIRGHRRTYVGALPGRIIQGIRNAGTNNPVFMLDEIDKIGADFRGDPSSALLEVLDPEQNHAFSDHYIEVPFDLSKVMFIATANITDTILPALRDRMEIIELPGYTQEEKLEIAKNYLVPRQLSETGLSAKDVEFTEEAIMKIIEEYTREAGVRNLEREIGSVLRKIARRFAEGEKEHVKITPEKIEEFLGPPKYYSEIAAREKIPGIATGLAWTPTGGEILFIESTKMRGNNNLILTGSLGEVMKESAQAALSYLKSNARKFNIPEESFEKCDIHIHVPQGAIPKDGPSAGIAIAMSLFSLFTQKPIDPKIAMTGEITLSGRVLPVGGIKEKILGAKRAGITTVILPKENEKDLKEVPEKAKKDMRFVFVENIDQAIKFLFDSKRA